MGMLVEQLADRWTARTRRCCPPRRKCQRGSRTDIPLLKGQGCLGRTAHPSSLLLLLMMCVTCWSIVVCSSGGGAAVAGAAGLGVVDELGCHAKSGIGVLSLELPSWAGFSTCVFHAWLLDKLMECMEI